MTIFTPLFLLLTLLAPSNTSSTIALQLKLAESEAVLVGVPVSLQDETGAVLATCTSDENGRCLLTAEGSAGSVIRGRLDLGSSGRRSLIFTMGNNLDLTLEFDRFGHLQTAHHAPHPTIASYQPQSWPTLAPAITATAILTATPIYVVIDPAQPTIETVIPIVTPEVTRSVVPTAVTTVTPTKQSAAPGTTKADSAIGWGTVWFLTLATLIIGLAMHLWRRSHVS